MIGLRGVAFAALLMVAAPLSAATITGTVRDAATGAALPSIAVDAYTPAGSRVTGTSTSATGGYTLQVPSGSYRILAYDPAGTYATSFHSSAESFDVSLIVPVDATRATNVDFTLERAGWIIGVVAGGGQPLADAVVTAYNPSGTTRGSARTDATGTYRLTVPAGRYRIAAWDLPLAFVPTFHGGVRTFAAAPEVSVATSTETRADFALPPAAYVSGVVTNAATNEPLSGIVVDVWRADGTYVTWVQTNAAGEYRSVVEAGSYRLVFSHPTGAFAPAYLAGATSFAASPPVTVSAGETAANANARMAIATPIRGRVIDAISRVGIGGMSVAAWNEDGTARTIVRTNATGQFVLFVPSGTYRVGAWDENLRYQARFYVDTSTFSLALPLYASAGEVQPPGEIEIALPPATSSRRRAVGRK